MMEPRFFGPGGELYGCYHVPRAGLPSAGSAVLLCYPDNDEYLFAHRSFRQLGAMLARAGRPVFRFDYFGCGDSRGELHEARVFRWIDDVCGAVACLSEQEGVERVALLGVRLGATLAALAGERIDALDKLVLWDPVITGASFVQQLRDRHRELLESLGWVGQSGAVAQEGDAREELLGFVYDRKMLEELAAIDLSVGPACPAREVLVVHTDSSSFGDGGASPDVSAMRSLIRRLEACAVPCRDLNVPGPAVWRRPPSHGLVPFTALQAIMAEI